MEERVRVNSVVQRSVEGVRQQEILLCFPVLFIYLFIYTAFGNAGETSGSLTSKALKTFGLLFSPF